MALDKLESNTARWTLHSNDGYSLDELTNCFNAWGNIKTAKLTAETLCVSVDLDTAQPEDFEFARKTIERVGDFNAGKLNAEVIYSKLPELG